jgi:hypothetical protein
MEELWPLQDQVAFWFLGRVTFGKTSQLSPGTYLQSLGLVRPASPSASAERAQYPVAVAAVAPGFVR